LSSEKLLEKVEEKGKEWYSGGKNNQGQPEVDVTLMFLNEAVRAARAQRKVRTKNEHAGCLSLSSRLAY
jgi:hypothetical protein